MSSSDDETSIKLPSFQKNIEKCLDYEFEQRRQVISTNQLEFNVCIPFITYLKILLDIYKKITKTIDLYISPYGMIISCCNNIISKNVNLRVVFKKDSFLDFYTTEEYIHIQLPLNNFLQKLKTNKRNYFFRMYKKKNENSIVLSNIPIFQIKINKLNFDQKENCIPLSGVIYDYEEDAAITEYTISYNNISYQNLNLGYTQDERNYMECLNDDDKNVFNINSNIFCKLVSFFNKNKLINVEFCIETYRKDSSPDIKTLRIKGIVKNNNINIESKEFVFYKYDNFRITEDYTLDNMISYSYPLTYLNYFIKIKNLNQETNNVLKLIFYKDNNLFIESLVNNLGIFTINLN